MESIMMRLIKSSFVIDTIYEATLDKRQILFIVHVLCTDLLQIQ